MDLLNAVAGLVVGLLVGMTGAGGGALMTPMLVLIFAVAPTVAVGTDLWFAATTKLVGGILRQQHGSVDWQVLRRLSLGSLPTALMTLLWLHVAGLEQVKQGLIMAALGAVLLFTAVSMLMRTHIHAWGRSLRSRAPVAFKRAQPGLTVLAGAILGFLVTLTSVGAGAMGVVMLIYLYPFRMKPQRLIGTDIVHAIPLTIVAGTGHLLMGHVDLRLLVNLLIGSIPGVILGTIISVKTPDRYLNALLAIVLVLAGIKLILA